MYSDSGLGTTALDYAQSGMIFKLVLTICKSEQSCQ